MNISCILTKQSLHTIPFYSSEGVHLLTETLPTFWAERIWTFSFLYFLEFLGILNSQISRSPEIWPGPSVGRAGPGLGRVGPRVGREGFLGGAVNSFVS